MDNLEELIQSNSKLYLGSGATIENVWNDRIRRAGEEDIVVGRTQLHCLVVGELLGQTQGSKFGASGNRRSQGRTFFKPVEAGESVKDVTAIKAMTNGPPLLKLVWQNQVEMLHRIECLAETEKTIASRDITWRSLFNDGGTLAESIQILWEKYEDAASTDCVPALPSNIALDALYDPHVLPGYRPPYFGLDLGGLKQNNIMDEHGSLVPPWALSQELRRGSLMLFLVSLHSKTLYNDKNEPTSSFEMSYEMRGHGARILKKGLADEEIPRSPHVPVEFLDEWRANCEAEMMNSLP